MEGWERIKLIIEKEGLNKNSFSAAIGLNNNVTITRIINEHRSPSISTFIICISEYSFEIYFTSSTSIYFVLTF